MTEFLRTRTLVAIAALLWLVHAGVIVAFGTKPPGPLLSDLVQLALGGVLIYTLLEASRRSDGLGRSFWRLSALAYLVWFVAQVLAVYRDLAASTALSWADNLLFSVWFVPLAMAIVLNPEQKAGRIDALVPRWICPESCRTKFGCPTSPDMAL